MADPPTERHVPVGYRFHPTDQELVCHYLRHKLMADDPSIHETVPEIGLCKYEPQDLLARAASAVSATKFDDFQCYFFSPRDYKHPKGKRINRTTSGGFWKVTGEDGIIIDSDTNNVIGKKKHLVYYKGRGPHACGTNWIVHEYYDDRLPSEQNTHVVCWLKKKDEKKIKGKTHKRVANKRKSTFRNVTQRKVGMDSNEFYSSNLNSTFQLPSQVNESTDSMIQPLLQFNESTDSMIQSSPQFNKSTDFMIQPSPQFNEATDSMIQPPPQFNEAADFMIQPLQQFNEATDFMIQHPSQFNGTTDLMIQLSPQFIEVTDSMIQPPPQFNEATDSMIQPLQQFNEVTDSMIQPSPQFNEITDSMIQPLPQLNETTDLMIQPLPQLNEATDSMTQLFFQPNEVTYSIIQQTSQVDEALNSIIRTPLEPNFAVATFDGELFEQGEFDLGSPWQWPPTSSRDEQEPFDSMVTSDMHEA